MALDWGIYSALRSLPDKERELQMRKESLGYMAELARLSEQRLQEQQQQQQAIEEVRAAFDEVRGLNRDNEALRRRIAEEEQRIVEGIVRANGDAKRYLNTGGLGDLRQYYSNVKNSEEMNTLLQNKQSQAMYLQSKQQGLIPIPTVVKDNETGETRIMDFEEQLQAYEQGKIDKLEWLGAEKPIVIDPLRMLSIPNPDGAYSRHVKVSEYETYLISQGQHPLVARMRAEEARVGNTNYTHLKFGPNRMLLQQQMAKASLSTGLGRSVNMFDLFQRGELPVKTQVIARNTYDDKGREIETLDKLKPGQSGTQMSVEWIPEPKIKDIIKDQIGIYSASDGLRMALSGGETFEALGSGKKVIIDPVNVKNLKVQSFRPVYKTVQERYVDENGRVYNSPPDRRAYAEVIFEFMKDSDVADIFKDAETKEPIYKTKWYHVDTPAQGYERSLFESPEDDDLIRVRLLKEIVYTPTAGVEGMTNVQAFQPQNPWVMYQQMVGANIRQQLTQ